MAPQIMFHDDDCDEPLDKTGLCPQCGFHPDMQSTGFIEISTEELMMGLKGGKTFLGQYRIPIERKEGMK